MPVQLLAAVPALLAALSLQPCLMKLLPSLIVRAHRAVAAPPCLRGLCTLSCRRKAGLCWVSREEAPI